jgi:hypothetical protein
VGRTGERYRGWGAFLYGQARQVRYKAVLCLWRVLGHDVVVKAVVAAVEGYRQRFTLVTSATDLSGLQMLELFCARFRQEDAFRDLKQRLGWERPVDRRFAEQNRNATDDAGSKAWTPYIFDYYGKHDQFHYTDLNAVIDAVRRVVRNGSISLGSQTLEPFWSAEVWVETAPNSSSFRMGLVRENNPCHALLSACVDAPRKVQEAPG